MAKQPRSPSRSRQPWREKPAPAAPEVKRIQRWLLTIAIVALVGILIWLFWLPRGHTTIAYLNVDDYVRSLGDVPPVPFGQKDREAWSKARAGTLYFPNHQIFGSMTSLDDNLRAEDTLILYVAAHGFSIDGTGYLLCSDFAPPDKNCIEIQAFLEMARRCADGEIILLLDAGHLPTAPRLGMIVNEFPRLLADAVAKTNDDKLWVLSANGMHETSRISHADGRSLFSYYVARALAGDADVNPRDSFVDLAELVAFVGEGVMQQQVRPAQTPRLLWGGARSGHLDESDWSEIEKRLHDVSLVYVDVEEPGSDTATARLPAGRSRLSWLPLDVRAMTLAAAITAQPPTESGDRPAAAPSTDEKQVPAAPNPEAGQPETASPAEGGGKATLPADAEQKGTTAGEPAPTKPKEQLKEQVKEPEAKDRWSDLERAWQLRDERVRRATQGAWTPVDYAPHLWRRYEMLILAHESRLRGGLEGEASRVLADDLDELEDNLAASQRMFIASTVREDLDQPRAELWRTALQLRNDCLYHAVHLVVWHARGVQRAGAKVSSQMIRDFLAKLAALEEQLQEQRRDALDERAIKNLSDARQRIGQQLQNEIEEIKISTSRDAAMARRVEDLLSTPLLGAEQRVMLLRTLEQTKLVLDAEQVADRCAAEYHSRRVLDRMRDASDDSNDASRRASEHAALEARLVALIDPEAASRLEEAVNVPSTDLGPAIAAAGGTLSAFYQTLPEKIAEATRQNDAARLRLADLGLRLLPGHDANQLEANDAIARLSWAPPILRGFEFVGIDSGPLTFEPAQNAEELELTGALQALENFHDKVNLELRYDPAQLIVVPIDERLPSNANTPTELSIGANAALDIAYRIRPTNPRRATRATLELRATSGSFEPASRTVEFRVPAPQDIDLVVMRDGQRQESPSSGEVVLRAFPGHVTDFEFHLQQHSGSPRTVSVELYGASDLGQLRAMRRRRAEHRFEPSDATLLAYAESAGTGNDQKEQGQKQIELTSDEPTRIPWTSAVPKPPAPPPGASEAKPPEAPVLAGGMLCCVVKDLQNQQLDPMVTWIEVAPWAPRNYLKATAVFAQDRTVRIELTNRAGAVLPRDGPVKIDWTNVPEQQAKKSKAELSRDKPTDELLTLPFAIGPRTRRDLEASLDKARLDVDGYPRAFVFNIPFDANRREIEPLKDLRQIELTPLSNVAVNGPGGATIYHGANLSGGDEIRFQVRVDAPDTWFQRGDREDYIELLIDKNENGRLESSEVVWRDFAPRQATLRLEGVEADGRASIRATVTDWTAAFANDLSNFQGELIARLRHGTEIAEEDSAPIIVDGAEPFIRPIEPEGDAYPGGMVQLRIVADDALSGVRSVSVVRDENRNRIVDGGESEQLKTISERNVESGVFTVPWPVPDTASPRDEYALLVWATDNVGLESAREVVRIVVQAKPQPADDKGAPARTKGSFRGVVTDGGEPAANVKITMTPGNLPSTTSDRQGVFEFKDLLPGPYEFEARGIVKNRFRFGSQKAMMPMPPPKDPVGVSVQLGDKPDNSK